MGRTSNGAPEFLRRAEAADAGAQGYTLDERREPPIDLDNPLGPDDYGGRKRPSPSERVNLARLENAISEVAAENVAARKIAINPLEDLKRRILLLTFGQMMDACAGILAATENSPISTKEELAKVIDRWASSNNQGDVISNGRA